MNFFKQAFGIMQQIGKALMLPVAVLPVAGILLGIGASKYGWMPENLDAVLKSGVNIFTQGWPTIMALGVALLKIMGESGQVIFSNLPLIFAIGVALGLTKNDGVSALAAVVGYMVMNATMGVMATIRGLDTLKYCPDCGGLLSQESVLTTSSIMGIKSVDTGVFGGIIIGIITAYLFNKYYRISLPPYLGFFAGKRFVPIVTAFAAILTGIVLSFIWPPIGALITMAGNWAANENPSLAATIYGVVERSLLPFGLHHAWNAPFFFQMGSFTTPDGNIVQGDITRFFNGDPTAGILGGGFLFKMWGLPAAAIAIWHSAKPENKVQVGGIMMSAALTSFLTGITEPIEFSFLFVAPALYAIHAVLVGTAFYVMNAVGAHMGFTFSQGCIDYLLYFHNDTNPSCVLWLGPIYALIYYVVFRKAIEIFNFKTPGREEQIQESEVNGGSSQLAAKVLQALGGQPNLVSLDACITRLRVGLKDINAANPDALKALGAAGVVIVGNNLQAIFGTLSENLKSDIEEYIKSGCPGNAAPLPSSAPATATDEQPVEVSESVRKKAAEFASLAGGASNLDNIHLASLTRVVFQAKDTSKVDTASIAARGFNLMILSKNRFHLVCDLQEAAAMKQALLETRK
ncbi:MAG: glucose-specific PTS transporter subunit IIBC [Candidatus Bruticola sp.]